MGVVPPGELEGGGEGLAAVRDEALVPEGQVGLDELDVGALGEGVGYDLLVLLYRYGTVRCEGWSVSCVLLAGGEQVVVVVSSGNEKTTYQVE